MIGMDGSDAAWATAAAFGTALAGYVALKIPLVLAKIVDTLKSSYLEWFAEAVDEHVEPKFAALRRETAAGAAVTRAELVAHTEAEGLLVREVVREELEPITARLDRTDDSYRDLKKLILERNP